MFQAWLYSFEDSDKDEEQQVPGTVTNVSRASSHFSLYHSQQRKTSKATDPGRGQQPAQLTAESEHSLTSWHTRPAAPSVSHLVAEPQT